MKSVHSFQPSRRIKPQPEKARLRCRRRHPTSRAPSGTVSMGIPGFLTGSRDSLWTRGHIPDLFSHLFTHALHRLIRSVIRIIYAFIHQSEYSRKEGKIIDSVTLTPSFNRFNQSLVHQFLHLIIIHLFIHNHLTASQPAAPAGSFFF